jgi:hypothetical protein
MRYKIWDRQALEMYNRANLSHQQRTFIESIARSLEAGTFLSEHVSTANSVVLSLTRAHHALDGHNQTGQPYLDLVQTMLARAIDDTVTGVPAYSVTSNGTATISQVRQTLAHAATRISSSPSGLDKQQVASQITALVHPAALAVRSLFEALWNSANLPVEVARRIRDEVAVLVVLEGRDGWALQSDLLGLLRRGTTDASAVADVLWPSPERYRIALAVSGARSLEAMDHFLPGTRQWPLVGPTPPPGLPYLDVKGLVDPVLSSHGSSVLITLPVAAPDSYTAIARARRDVAEALDQYAAGQRILELTIDSKVSSTIAQ